MVRNLAEQETDLPERLSEGILAGHDGLSDVCYRQTVDKSRLTWLAYVSVSVCVLRQPSVLPM